MFKKGYRVSNTANLKKSDVRRIRERFLRERQDLEFTQTLVQAKLSNSRGSVYLDGYGVPLFIDLGLAQSCLLPTIFCLWMVPETIVTITIDVGVLVPLLRGADFMAAGLKAYYPSDKLPRFERGAAIALQLPNGRCVAVGTAKVGTAKLMENGLQGKLVEIQQCLGDHLFVHALPEDLLELQPSLNLPPRAVVEEEKEETPADVLEAANQELLDKATPEEEKEAEEEEAAAREEAAREEARAKSEEIAEAVQRQETKVSMDDLLRMSFLQAIREAVDPGELPMPASSFYSLYVLPSRPRNTILDIKKTSWKKLTKFLKQMEKEKLVTTKSPPKTGMQVYSVNAQHPTVLAHEVYKRMADNNQALPTAKQEGQDAEEEPGSGQVRGFSLTTVYQAGKLFDLFKEAREEARRADLYSAKEAADLLWAYVEEKQLTVAEKKSCVTLTALLAPAVKSKQLKEGDQCEKKVLAQCFGETLSKFTLVQRDGSTTLHKGTPQMVTVKEERRGGNKYVTGVQGLEYYVVKPEAAAKKLRSLFAASTTVNEVPMGKSKPARSEVIVQGKVAARTADALEEHFGIPKRYVNVVLGKAKPAKKRK